MESEVIEHFLLNYFNEIRWVNTDIVLDEIVTTIKKDGKIISKSEKQKFTMLSLLNPSIEEFNRLLYLEVSKCEKNMIKVPGLIYRMFGRTLLDNIEICTDDWIITSSDIYKKHFINNNINVYIADNFKDIIIIGNKNIKVMLHENLDKFYIDSGDLKIYEIKKSR